MYHHKFVWGTRQNLDLENPAQRADDDGKLHLRSILRALFSLRMERKQRSSMTTREIYDAIKENFSRRWNMIYVTSCVFAVILDPLFFYIPFIDQDNKCLGMDKKLETSALLCRAFTDIILLVHFIHQIYYAAVQTQRLPSTTTGGDSGKKSKIGKLIVFAKNVRAEKMPWLSMSTIIDFFSLLPFPQLLVVLTFYKMRGSGALERAKFVDVFLLGQYVLRIFRIHQFFKDHSQLAKGLFYFFVYIVASHILGAFWYFFSIQRETSCWYWACANYSTTPNECMTTFYCDRPMAITSRNITFLNEHCSLDTSAPFKFGIFLDSLQNQTKEHVNLGKKLFYSFWWGLRNISNFGTNLTTSTFIWENLFAILISTTGFLLLLYLIGTAQNFLAMEATKSEELREKIKMKKLDIYTWISGNELPDDLRKDIMHCLKQKLKDHKYADVQNDLFSILPIRTKKSLKRCLCMKPLKTLPMLEKMNTTVLEMMCDYLKPVAYNKNNFVFRMGDPVDRMLFIVEGTMWIYSTTSTDGDSESAAGKGVPSMATKPLRKGAFYGQELLNWASSTFTQLPISTQHVKCQTKVEAFALMALDLETVVSLCQVYWDLNNCKEEGSKKDMARTIITKAVRNRNRRHNQRATAPDAAGGASIIEAPNAPAVHERPKRAAKPPPYLQDYQCK